MDYCLNHTNTPLVIILIFFAIPTRLALIKIFICGIKSNFLQLETHMQYFPYCHIILALALFFSDLWTNIHT